MNILIVEDDRMHANFILEIVRETLPEHKEILIAQDGREGENIARQHRTHAIVMDLRMRERNGIEAARTIWSERPDTRILFWSNHSDDAYMRGIAKIVPPEAAYGYVLKTASMERMKLALRAVLVEGQIVVDSEIHQVQSLQSQRNLALSDVEHDILLDVAIGLPDKVIATRRKLSLRTVQNRLLSIYDKLEVASVEEKVSNLQINKRVRAVSVALIKKIINVESIELADKNNR